MPTRSRITSKAQVTVPLAVREAMRIGPGDEIEWRAAGDEFVIRKITRKDKSPLDKWVGVLEGFPGMDTDEIMEMLRGPRLDDDLS